MIIVFKGNDVLTLKKRLQDWSGKDERSTLTFMLENFEIPDDEEGIKLTKADIIKARNLGDA